MAWMACNLWQALLKRHRRHLNQAHLNKALRQLKAKYGFLDQDLPALIVRRRDHDPAVLTYASLNVKRFSDFSDMIGLQVRGQQQGLRGSARLGEGGGGAQTGRGVCAVVVVVVSSCAGPWTRWRAVRCSSTSTTAGRPASAARYDTRTMDCHS